MQEQQFLEKVAKSISKGLSGGGYRDVEYYDENIVKMNGPVGENMDGDVTVARMFKPISEDDIIITLSYKDDNKYEIIVTLGDDVDFVVFDKEIGDYLKRLAGFWGSRLEYKLHTWGREIKSKPDIAMQIKGEKYKEEVMDNHLAEANVKMTGTSRSSYQRIGECKVIIRHSGRVNEEKFGARSRNIDSIFIETKRGERFKVAENNLNGARAMARHLSNGGSPFDTVGTKITEMMSDMTKLREMVNEARKVGRNRELSEEQTEVISQIRNQYVTLRETLKKMAGKLGYMRHSTMEDFELPSDKMLGRGKHAGQGTTGTTLPLKGIKKKAEPTDSEVLALVAKSPKYGRRHLRADRVDWDNQDMALYTAAKKELMGINESIKVKNEKTTTRTLKKSKEEHDDHTLNKEDAPQYDRPTDGRFPELMRDADNLFSVNEDSIAPEERILESWFNDASMIEFFNEEELVIEEDAPKTLKTLPENALGMLNMYKGHPLFSHYMKVYEDQEILNDIFALVEEDSVLWNAMMESKETLNENMDESDDDFDPEGIVEKINSLISDRRLSLDNAIDEVAASISETSSNEGALEEIVEKLWGMAEEAGLVKHDFGSTFSDNVLAPNETISAHNAEIDAEEFYGDAMFAEDLDDEMGEEPFVADEPEEQFCHECGEPFVIDDNGIANHVNEFGEIDYDADANHVPFMLDDDYYDDSMDGDHDSAMASAGWGSDEDYGSFGDDDMYEEMNRVRINAGLPPLVREEVVDEGDPFARQSKRNLKNPKARMSLINPKDKMGSSTLGEDEVDEAKARPDWASNRENSMIDRLDRGGYGDRVRNKKTPDAGEDKYAKMARDRGIPDKDTPTAHQYGQKKTVKPRYEEVEMPHHLPQTPVPEGTPELSEDGARIIQLARFRR